MTQEEAKVMWPIIKAWGEGANLQIKGAEGKWVTVSKTASATFSLGTDAYRLEPKPREFWINHYAWGYGPLHATKDEMLDNRGRNCCETLHLKEVLE